ncbi:MAG: pyruvate kinase, partial [Butyrivibrio sp.]
DSTRIGLTYDKLAKYVSIGTNILIDDGKIALKVTDIKGSSVICKVVNGGRISNHKSINLPNMNIPMPYISDADKSDILFGIRQKVDFIAASFVRSADDVKKLRKLLKDNGGERIQIISKIENGQGVNNLEEIIDASDGIMVARGDLGVEIAFEKIPAIQKNMINMCNDKGKIVVTATQMLESMTQNPRPTRAEVSDVANAIYDGTTAIMLSGESAAGAYPVEAVKTMAQIALTAESSINYYSAFVRDHNNMEPNVVNAVCASAYSAAEYLDAKAIIVMTRSGRTARTLSCFHPPCPIIAVTIDDMGLRQLKLTWNVTPIAANELDDPNALLEHALAKAKDTKVVKKGDKVIAILASDIKCDNNIMRICIV